MRRAAVSMSSNIAEGSSRSSKNDFARFVEIATGSVFEVVSQAFIGSASGIFSRTSFRTIYDAAEEQSRMLSGLRKSSWLPNSCMQSFCQTLNSQLSTMNFHLRVWRQKGPKAKGKLVQYEATDVSPNTSFLEMLDIVNEDLWLEAKGANRVRFGLSRRHLRHLLAHDQWRSAWPRSPRRRLRSLHAAIQGWRDDRGGAFPGETISIDKRSGRRSERARPDRPSGWFRLRAGRFRARSKFNPDPEAPCGSAPWKRPPASVAARVRRPVPMRRRCCSPPRRFRIWRSCLRGSQSGQAAF